MASPRWESCFDRSIALERMIEKYYRTLSREFQSREDIGRFFLEMASDEAGHAKTLENAKMLGTRLERPQNEIDDVADRIGKLEEDLAEKTKSDYRDLDQVFLRVYGIEKSELNKIFLLLMLDVLGPGTDSEHLVKLLERHIEKVSKLGVLYKAEERAMIKPQR